MLETLKQKVYEANMQLPQLGLVDFTWGNVSGIDREKGVFVIKPSGVPYAQLKPSDMVVINLKGEVVEGELNPSSDTPTHTYLYNHFPDIGGITHTHSPWAVAYAAAELGVEPMNTTFADTFYDTVPVTPGLTKAEIEQAYEENTGKVIVKTFEEKQLDPMAVPAVLVGKHGPFTWGKTPNDSVYNAKVLEITCEMNYHATQLTRANCRVPQYLLDKHYYRKHGDTAYYGQHNAQSHHHIAIAH